MSDAFTNSNPSADCEFYIGEVSRRTGASPKAIRLYEARGLIPPPERRNAYRLYSERHVFLVHVIKMAQTVGFTLAELHGLLGQTATGHHFPLDLANDLIGDKAAQLRREHAAITATLRRLKALRIEMNNVFAAPPDRPASGELDSVPWDRP